MNYSLCWLPFVVHKVRGRLVLASMGELAACAAYLGQHSAVRVRRVKNRFKQPTDDGWVVSHQSVSGVRCLWMVWL